MKDIYLNKRPSPWTSRLLKLGVAMLSLGLLGACVLLAMAWTALGKAPAGERLARMEASPLRVDGKFVNPQPLWNDPWGMLRESLSPSEYANPTAPIQAIATDPALFATPPDSGLRVTWLGHSTLLIEIEGKTFLTDPVWGERTSPIEGIGPQRWYAPPLALPDLPPIDAVLLSHDHYDHLDTPTIIALKDMDTTFVTSLGVGAHLAYWGVPEDRIVELEWWEERAFGGITLVAAPARHASGRQVLDQNRTLWNGYALIGPNKRAFFSGDTGLFPGMTEIGERLGPFDVTMLEVGAYGMPWPDWHLGPEQAVRAHRMLRGDVLLPIHWGLFNLAYHGWTEPIERLLVEADAKGVPVVAPRPGGTFEPAMAPEVERWWPSLPWQTAEEYPIVARLVDSE